MAVALVFFLAGCHSEQEPPPRDPYHWATAPVVKDLVSGDRAVLSPPLGYEFSYISIPHLKNNRHWVSTSGGQRIPGLGVQGSWPAGVSWERDLGELCHTRERYLAERRQVPRVQRLEPGLVDGETACRFRGFYPSYTPTPQEIWVLCRKDNCWIFILEGVMGSRSIPGELIAAMETVRFVPPVEEIPDFRLGKASAGAPECPTCSRR